MLFFSIFHPSLSSISASLDSSSAVRKIFPKLQFLDGVQLPALITFDDDDDADTLPHALPKMVCEPQAESVVLQFLEQYFKVYDSDNREALMDAYHEQGLMSMSFAYPPNIAATGINRSGDYIHDSRNLVHLTPNRRSKQIREGKLAIVSLLNELPKTTHDTNSFTLDMTFATEKLMTFTVTGLYKERAANKGAVRHFSRMFVVVPQGSGFVIVNEMLFVTVPTKFQLTSAFTAASTPVPTVTSPTAAAAIPADAMARLTQLAERTGMNQAFAKQCLEVSAWDLEKAFVAFQTAQIEGKIPAEAFVK